MDFEIGDEVYIIGNDNVLGRHRFEIGERVEIIDYFENGECPDGYEYDCEGSSGATWYVHSDLMSYDPFDIPEEHIHTPVPVEKGFALWMRKVENV